MDLQNNSSQPALNLLANSKITIFCGHASPESFVVANDYSKQRPGGGEAAILYNTDIYLYNSATNTGTVVKNLSNVDVVIFAGCAASGTPPTGKLNIADSAARAGATASIGWTENTVGGLME